MEDELVDLSEFISVKGLKAIGNKLSAFPVTEVLLEPADEEKEKAAMEAVLADRQGNEKEDADQPAEEEVGENTEEPQNQKSDKKEIKGVPDEISQTIELDTKVKPKEEKKDKPSDNRDSEGQTTLF